MKLWLPRQDWGTGIGDFIQITSVIPPWQHANPGQEVVIAYQTMKNTETCFGIPGVTYVEAEEPPDGTFLNAFECSPRPPRSVWWERWGLDYFKKRLHWFPSETERAYAAGVWGLGGAPKIVIQRRGGMWHKFLGCFDLLADFFAREIGANVIVLDPWGESRAKEPGVRRSAPGRLRDTLALVGGADLYVGWDSGPLYAALGQLVPTVGIFSVWPPQGLYWPVTAPANVALEGVPDAIPPLDIALEAIQLLRTHGHRLDSDRLVARARETMGGLVSRGQNVFVMREHSMDWLAFGEHEPWLEPFMLLPPDGVFLDIGAHVGKWSVWAAPRCAAVHAFEPHPENVAGLERNLAANLLTNVTVHGCGLGERAERALIKSRGGSSPVSDEEGDTRIELRTLDSFGEFFERADLVKIDVEGMENEVLRGGMGFLRRFKPRLVIESHSCYTEYGGTAEMLKETLELLKSIGYKPRMIRDDPPYVEAVWAGRDDL